MIKKETKKVEKKEVEVKIEEPIYIGDKITTTKKSIFGPNVNGIVRKKIDKFFGIELLGDYVIPENLPKNEYPHTLQGLLTRKNGYVFDRSEFKIVGRKKYTTEIEKVLDLTMKEASYIEMMDMPKKIRQKESEMENMVGYIHSSEQEIRRYKQRLEDGKRDIKFLKAKVFDENQSYGIDLYQKMIKTKKIYKVSITPNYLVVTTRNLKYTDKRNPKMPVFDLGRFKIFIPLKSGVNCNDVKAVNITRQLSAGYYGHPCLENSRHICMGNAVSDVITQYLVEKDYYGIVLVLINFFEEPNYGTPYRPAHEFYCAQPVTCFDEIKNEEDWLNKISHCKWDDERFIKEKSIAMRKFTNLGCRNCGESRDECECEYCDDCGNLAEQCSCENDNN